MMISRLVISLRKTVDGSLVQVWDEDHFTAAESGVHEMVDFAGPSSSQTPLSPTSIELPSRFETIISSCGSSFGSVRTKSPVLSLCLVVNTLIYCRVVPILTIVCWVGGSDAGSSPVLIVLGEIGHRASYVDDSTSHSVFTWRISSIH